MTDLVLTFLAGLAAGLAVHVWASWRLAKATGQPLRMVILGGPNQPEGPV